MQKKRLKCIINLEIRKMNNVSIICDSYHPSRYIPFEKLKQESYINKLNFIKLNKLKKNPLITFSLIFQLIILVFKKNIVIIACAPLNPLVIYFLLLKYLKRCKLIYDTSFVNWESEEFRYIKIEPFKSFFKKLWFKFLKDIKIRAINESSYSFLSKFSQKTMKIPHSVNTKIFFRNKKIRKKKIFTVLFVGKVEYKKGLDLILKVSRKLPYINFWIVGSGSYLKELKNKKPPNIKMFGKIKDKKRLNRIYNQAHCLILPSRRFKGWEELFGIVIIEAMAVNLPVIATDCVGPKEIIKNDYDGFIIPQNDEKSLKQKILYLYKNASVMNMLGKRGNAKVLKNYELTRIAEELFNLIKNDKVNQKN